jgi:hypothetical protein
VRAPPECDESARTGGEPRPGDANAGVAHHEFDLPPHLAQRDGNLAGKGKLKGIGKQIEDNLLPHLPVYVDRLRERRAINEQAQPGLLKERAKDACQIGSERGQIGGRVHCLGTSGLDTRKIQQGIDQFEQAQPVALHQGKLLVDARLQRVAGQQVFQRSEHQGQRGAKLVADIAEEGGFGTIQPG